MAPPTPPKDEVKQRAMRRLMVAGGVTGAALLALALLGDFGGEEAPRPIDEAPRAAVPEPEPLIEPEALPEEAPAPEAETGLAEPPPEQSAPAPVAPPPAIPAPSVPARVASKPGAPVRPAASEAVPVPAPAPVVPRASSAPAVPAPGTPPPPTSAPPAPSAPKGFTVQLGVFGDTDNALALHRRLQQAGVGSRIETRLFLGPFATRAEADAALAKMRKMGVQAVVEERR